ncbi:MAG: hypothetical protein WCW68_01655 [Methanothrix sp.]|jgi:hypothetical protein
MIENRKPPCRHMHCVAIPEKYLRAKCLDCGATCVLQIKKIGR